MYKYALNTNVEVLSEEIVFYYVLHLQKIHSELINTKASIEYTDKAISESNYKVFEEIKDLAKRSELIESIYSMDDKINEFKEKFENDLNQFQEINEMIDGITMKMQKYSLSKDVDDHFEKINAKFKDYLKVDSFKTELDRLEEITYICKENVNNFNVDNIQMKKIVMRFDEIILDKASKHTVKLLESRMDDFATKSDLEQLKKIQKDEHFELKNDIEGVEEKIASNYAELNDTKIDNLFLLFFN